MDVLHEGYLEKCLNPDENKREWKKRYFVLKKAIGSGTQTFEYYKEKEWRKQEPKGVLTLFAGYTTVKVNDPKKKHTFEVKTIDGFFTLSAGTEESRDTWLETLRQHSAGKIFNITLEVTAKSKELDIANEQCALQITSSSVLLLLGSGPAISWPFNCIRRYKCHPGIFLLEVGRKAPTGEGEFRFITQEGQDIFEILGKAVSNRMSAKRGNDYQPDFISNPSSQAAVDQDTSGSAGQVTNIAKGNMFIDQVGRSDNIRFVMKKRSTSSPPTSLSGEQAMNQAVAPPSAGAGENYSHLKFSPDKGRTRSEEDQDYDQLARAKDCNRFNKTRVSDSRNPSASSNKALKVLGLLRSNSVDSLPRTQTESAMPEASEGYAHLEFNDKKMKKSQSSDVLMDELKNAASNLKHRPDNVFDKQDDDGVFLQNDNVYNKLHSERPKAADVQVEDNLCQDAFASENAYDCLGAKQNGHSHRPRPEPIIVTDDAYDALSFGFEKALPDTKVQKPAISNTYEEAILVKPRNDNSVNDRLASDSGIDKARKNIEAKIMAKPAPPVGMKPAPPIATKPAPQIMTKPSVARKPAKPPRKTTQPASEDILYENTANQSPGGAVQDVVGGDVKSNLVAQLKKNLQGQGILSGARPLSPPPNAKNNPVQPFYAVSPFTRAGSNKEAQHSEYNRPPASSEYAVPSNNPPSMPRTSPKQMDFMYAVSPFHGGAQLEASHHEAESLYDSPKQQRPIHDDENVYDTPVPQRFDNNESIYDMPVQHHRGEHQDVIGKPRPAAVASTNSPNSNASGKFMYAVSPFAACHAMPDSQQGSYDDVGGVVDGGCVDEADYCEVGTLVRKFPPADYAEVGETFNSTSRDSESIYSVPRGEPR
eukprot:gene6450-7182_t